MPYCASRWICSVGFVRRKRLESGVSGNAQQRVSAKAPWGLNARCWRCLIATFFIAGYAINTRANDCFDDEALNQLAQRSASTGTLLYVWSPRMVLSVSQANMAAQAAKTQGLDFFPLVDARVPRLEWQAALKRTSTTNARLLRASQPLCAAQLMEQDALRHFPTSFVLTARGTHRFPIIGAMPAQAWQHSVAQRLQEAQP
jgi:hypothetical protein